MILLSIILVLDVLILFALLRLGKFVKEFILAISTDVTKIKNMAANRNAQSYQKRH